MVRKGRRSVSEKYGKKRTNVNGKYKKKEEKEQKGKIDKKRGKLEES